MVLKRPPQRISSTEKHDIIDLPNLIEVQVKSYNQFLQANKFSVKFSQLNPMMKRPSWNFCHIAWESLNTFRKNASDEGSPIT
jgi:DNA-directed RNA polymerase beta subunit